MKRPRALSAAEKREERKERALSTEDAYGGAAAVGEHDASAPESRTQRDTKPVDTPMLEFLVKKLITKEDPMYFHKLFGFLSVLSFLYRYVWVYSRRGDLGFDGSLLDCVSMGVHLTLGCSALIFRVVKQRIQKQPYVM